jgi:PST family polysaccharide transporter
MREQRETERWRYRSVLRSTSLIGGASAINIAIGMVRTKVVAVLIGPAGVGLVGLYTQLVALVSNVSGMGIANSGVRQVAEAVGTGDNDRVSRTVVTLRRTALVTGTVGMVATAGFCVQLSRISFGDTAHAWPIAALGITVLFSAIAAGQSCLMRGARRISDVARVTALGALSGTLLSLPCYFFLGIRGIVPALIVVSTSALATSWWFARRIPVAPVAMSWRDSWRESRALLTLGLSFMLAGLLNTGTTYFVQTFLVRSFGLGAAGIYQAAFSVSGALIGFVLGAMAADYYPRLTAVASDDAQVVREVNEQAQVAVLLATPGLAAMAVLAPVVIRLFYAPEFAPAVPILRWCILGLLGRVLSWPLGFVLLAKGSARLFLVTEALAAAVQISAVIVFTQRWGVQGAGIAFMFLYVVYTAVMLVVTERIVGASWTRRTWKLNLLSVAALAAVTANGSLNPEPVTRWVIGILFLGATAWLCLAQLAHRSGVSLAHLLQRGSHR